MLSGQVVGRRDGDSSWLVAAGSRVLCKLIKSAHVTHLRGSLMWCGRNNAQHTRRSTCARNDGPNVLFTVVDDLSPAFQQYGGVAHTPNLGCLHASAAVQFDFAFVSVAVCAPSRTAFLTGLRPDTTQVWTIGPYFRNASRGEGMDVVTLPFGSFASTTTP